jgi:RNA polymerase sigma-70 factor (ECF subfamily)
VTLTRDEIESELERLHQQSFAWALACCGRNPSDAEDVLQMTYLKVLDGSARYAGRSTFQTWLFGIIRRTAANKWRKFVNRDRLLRGLFQHQPEAGIPGPDTSLEYTGNAARLVQALQSLSQRQREVLQLVFYHGMTIEETAITLGIGVGSARTHYARGKQNLAKKLAEVSS